MKRWLALAVLGFARVAHATPVTVTVTELAGDLAFVDAGSASGLHAGSKVTFGGRELVVVEVTEKTAAVRVDAAGVQPGDTGQVDAEVEAPMPEVRPPDSFSGQWPVAVRPADAQKPPDEVRLGGGGETGARITASFTGYGTLSHDGVDGESEARLETSFQILKDQPLGADLDVAARAFGEGYNKHERTPILVRAATIRYGGTAEDPELAIGRLRYAATSVGMLDGARAATHVGDLELAAFGGITPDPVSGHPDTRATRFGVEAIYDAAESAWRPRVAVAVHGSSWNGDLDERRLSIAASAGHAATWLDGWLEVEQFASDNPWNAPAVQITGAGASADWRGSDGVHAGVDATFLRPDRSLRLDATVPLTWACTRIAKPGDVAEDCLDIDFWAAVTAAAGVRRDSWSIDAIATLGETHGVARYVDASGYLRGELRFGERRVFASASGGTTSFADWEALEGGAGIAMGRVDADLSYRPERLSYTAGQGGELLHSLVADLHVAASARFDVVVSAVGTTGSDRDVLAVLTTLVWRPR